MNCWKAPKQHIISSNFEVKDFHTYYVGEQGIFTHNMCKKAQIKNPSKSESRVWKGFKNSKNGLKTSGSGKNQRFYSWDNLHNEIEVFDRLGKHLGVRKTSWCNGSNNW